MSELKVAAGTLNLDVSLDTSANPPVVISSRKADANSGDKIKWHREGGALAFKFTSFEPEAVPFTNVDVADNKTECDFQPGSDPSGTEYQYTITVEYDGDTYTSDEADVTVPTEGKAVIRN